MSFSDFFPCLLAAFGLAVLIMLGLLWLALVL